jgi:hypothetical protein
LNLKDTPNFGADGGDARFRIVEAQQREPAFIRHCLDPVALLPVHLDYKLPETRTDFAEKVPEILSQLRTRSER